MKIEEIEEYILKKIRSGELRPGARIPSEYELADMFSVNKKTANKAVSELAVKGCLVRLKGRGGTIVADKSVCSNGSIAVFLSGAVSFYHNLLFGIQTRIFQLGYDTVFFNPVDANDFQKSMNHLKGLEPRGVIITHLPDMVPECRCPVLWLNDRPDIPDQYNYLGLNNREGGRRIAKHLLELGHTRIGCIVQNQRQSNLVDRQRGIEDELASAGLKPLFIQEFSGMSLSISNFLVKLLKRHPDTTAITCDGDHIAASVIIELRKRGIRVPEDISVTGFSNLPEIQTLLKITTIDENPKRIGAYAAEIMDDLISGKRTFPVEETYEIEFMRGESSARPGPSGSLKTRFE